MASPYKALQNSVKYFSEQHANEKLHYRPKSWRGCLYINRLSYPRFMTGYVFYF